MKKVIKNILTFSVLVIFISILVIDIYNRTVYLQSSTFLKYLCIFICFLISMIIGKDNLNKKDSLLLQLGLFFTLCADFFMLYVKNFTMGVFFFCVVQSIYIHRYRSSFYVRNPSDKKSKKSKLAIPFIIILSIIVIILLIPELNNKILYMICAIYAVLLLSSTYSGIKTIKQSNYPKKNSYFIAIGMILFLLCDINVGLSYILTHIDINAFAHINSLNSIAFITSLLVWIFYIPSQLLLSLSGHIYRER